MSAEKDTQLLQVTDNGVSGDSQETPDTECNDYMQRRRKAFVSYDTFLESYWAHFPQYLTKGLDMRNLFKEQT